MKSTVYVKFRKYRYRLFFLRTSPGLALVDISELTDVQVYN